jgi:hypothetical protein
MISSNFNKFKKKGKFIKIFWYNHVSEAADGVIVIETSPIHFPNINTTDFYLDRIQYIRMQPYQSLAEAKIEAYLQMIDLGIKVTF